MRRSLAAALAASLVLAACAADPSPATTAGAAPFPVTVRGITIPAEPQRIVSLSATHTEVLYAIGAGTRIVATDAFSDFPAAAADTEKVDAFNLSVEAVAALDPDLVILSYDPGDAMTGFAALGIPAILFAPPGPVTLEEVYTEWRDLAGAVGLATATEALIARVDGEIATIVGGVPQTSEPFTYFLELDSTLFTPGPGTLLDTLFGSVGLVSIADPAGGPFQQLSSEAVVGADPDFVFLADTVCCGERPETVAARPGWSEMSAVRDGRVVPLDDSVVSRWGPRLVDLLAAVVAAVHG